MRILKVFYCLSGTQVKGLVVGGSQFYASERTYENYSNGGTKWPNYFPTDPNSRVRIGYTYYPQSGTRTLSSITPPGKPALTPPAFARKSTELTAKYAIVTDLVYRLDMVTHRSGLKRGLGLDALFGDMHVQFQHDPSFFDTVNVWSGTKNDQNDRGGIEDRGVEFRWLMQAFKP